MKNNSKKDFFGTEVFIGDEIAFNPPLYKGLKKGKIVSFTPKGFRIEYKGTGFQGEGMQTTTAFEVIKNPKQLSENLDLCPECGQLWEIHDFGVPSPYCPAPKKGMSLGEIIKKARGGEASRMVQHGFA